MSPRFPCPVIPGGTSANTAPLVVHVDNDEADPNGMGRAGGKPHRFQRHSISVGASFTFLCMCSGQSGMGKGAVKAYAYIYGAFRVNFAQGLVRREHLFIDIADGSGGYF